MYVLIAILLLAVYALLGLLVFLMRGLITNQYLPDFDDFMAGELEPEEQNRIVLFMTFWPICLIYYFVRFFFKAIKAVYKVIVWYINTLISAIGDFLNKNVKVK